jgi:hypothetical protein
MGWSERDSREDGIGTGEGKKISESERNERDVMNEEVGEERRKKRGEEGGGKREMWEEERV